ncbi:hypothetical protein D3C78_1585720 [compost metagenome]
MAVVRHGTDIGFEVDVGIGSGTHHPRRRHFDRLQVHRTDFQARTQLRFADGVFLGLGQRSDQE